MRTKFTNTFDKIKAEDRLKDHARVFLKNEIEKREKKFLPSFTIKRIGAVAALMLICVCGFGTYAYYTPNAYLDIDINPSVELGVNRYNKVISVKAYNNDAQKVLVGTDLMNNNIESAVDKIIYSAAINGYIKENSDIAVTAQCNNEKSAQKLSETAHLQVVSSLNKHHISAQAQQYVVGYDIKKDADKYGITSGKLNIIKKLQETNPNAKVEDYVNSTITDIMKETRVNKTSRTSNSAQKIEGTAIQNSDNNDNDERIAKQPSGSVMSTPLKPFKGISRRTAQVENAINLPPQISVDVKADIIPPQTADDGNKNHNQTNKNTGSKQNNSSPQGSLSENIDAETPTDKGGSADGVPTKRKHGGDDDAKTPSDKGDSTEATPAQDTPSENKDVETPSAKGDDKEITPSQDKPNVTPTPPNKGGGTDATPSQDKPNVPPTPPDKGGSTDAAPSQDKPNVPPTPPGEGGSTDAAPSQDKPNVPPTPPDKGGSTDAAPPQGKPDGNGAGAKPNNGENSDPAKGDKRKPSSVPPQGEKDGNGHKGNPDNDSAQGNKE